MPENKVGVMTLWDARGFLYAWKQSRGNDFVGH